MSLWHFIFLSLDQKCIFSIWTKPSHMSFGTLRDLSEVWTAPEGQLGTAEVSLALDSSSAFMKGGCSRSPAASTLHARRSHYNAQGDAPRHCWRWPGTPYDEKSVFSRKLFHHFSQPPYSECVKNNEISKILHTIWKKYWNSDEFSSKSMRKTTNLIKNVDFFRKNQQILLRFFATVLSFDRCEGM